MLTLRTLLVACCALLSTATMAQDAKITNISDSAETVSPLLPGLIVPDATLKNDAGEEVALGEMLEAKPTVLVVYRGGWCPYCSRQLANIKKVEKQLADKGLQIIAIAPESPEKLAESTIESPSYTLLSDDKMELAQALGLAFFLDDKTAQAYRNKLGVNFVTLEGESKVALPVPAVFVIDTEKRIHFQYANPNYRVRLSQEMLLAAADLVTE